MLDSEYEQYLNELQKLNVQDPDKKIEEMRRKYEEIKNKNLEEHVSIV